MQAAVATARRNKTLDKKQVLHYN